VTVTSTAAPGRGNTTPASYPWPPVLAIPAVTAYTGGLLSRSRIYQLLKDGTLRGLHLGRRRGVTRLSVDELLAKLEGRP
jgi:hypothetical protein